MCALNARIGRETAVDGYAHAGDESRRGGADEKERCADEVVHLAEPAHGRCGEYFTRPLRRGAIGIPQQLRVLFGGKKAGRYGIDPYAYVRKVHGKPLREVGHRRLCPA